MGIFDFLKRIFSDNEVEKPEKQKMAFSEIKVWIENKEKEIEDREAKIFDIIKSRINILDKELEEKINLLERINIESKKAHDKEKSFTQEGRKKYIEFVELFVKNLNDLKQDKFDRLISNINHIFLDFNKHSRMSYERATILIGKEMGDTRDKIKSFSNDLIKIFGENKDIADSYKLISAIKIKLKQLEQTEKDINQINESVKDLDNKITEKEEQNKVIINEIEEIKKSPDYREQLKIQEKINLLKQDLEKDIIELRKLIDFKALASFYHIFEDKMEIVKAHNNKFLENFQKDNGQTILHLLDQSKLNTENISNKINEIHEKKQEIIKNQNENAKNPDKTQELYSKTTKIILEIADLKNLKTRAQKKLEKSGLSKNSLLTEVKDFFSGMNFEVE